MNNIKKAILITIALMVGVCAYAVRYETEEIHFLKPIYPTNATFSGITDFDAPVAIPTNSPAIGKVRIFGQTILGQEALYYMQADGTYYRIVRDSVVTVFNQDSTKLNPGEAVYATSDMNATAHYVKRAKADSCTTMPAFGIVTEKNGIETNASGTIMFFGRTFTNIDTSAFSTSGVSLYVSATVAGALTETEPTIPSCSQLVGFVNKKDAAGAISVRLYKPSQVKRPSFVASVTGTNGYVGGASNLVLFTTLVHADGISTYSTVTGAWTPPVGDCEVGAALRCRTSLLANKYVRLYLFKNGQYFCDLWDYTTAEAESPYMNPIYFFYNDASTNAYTLIFQPESTNTFSGAQNARWWGRLIEND